jgi:hypothetical protein
MDWISTMNGQEKVFRRTIALSPAEECPAFTIGWLSPDRCRASAASVNLQQRRARISRTSPFSNLNVVSLRQHTVIGVGRPWIEIKAGIDLAPLAASAGMFFVNRTAPGHVYASWRRGVPSQ